MHSSTQGVAEQDDATYIRSIIRTGTLTHLDIRRHKQLKLDNARLKKLLADAHLDNDILKCVLDHLRNE